MSSSNESLAVEGGEMKGRFVEEKDQIRVKRKTLQAVLEQCQRALELLNRTEDGIDDNDNDGEDDYDKEDVDRPGEVSGGGLQSDQEADELCNHLNSRIQCADFLEKLESAQVAVSEDIADCSSWDIINENDVWDNEVVDLDGEDYVLVRQEDIVEGVACFMAAYLLSLKQTKDLTPNQLQEALSKTFSVKKKKGKLRRAWDGSKVIYNVASWGATAVGIYQNPLLYQAASKAFWTSCNVISKLI